MTGNHQSKLMWADSLLQTHDGSRWEGASGGSALVWRTWKGVFFSLHLLILFASAVQANWNIWDYWERFPVSTTTNYPDFEPEVKPQVRRAETFLNLLFQAELQLQLTCLKPNQLFFDWGEFYYYSFIFKETLVQAWAIRTLSVLPTLTRSAADPISFQDVSLPPRSNRSWFAWQD